MKPITPKEVEENWYSRPIPDEVYQAVNELIEEKWQGNGYVKIDQDEIIARILQKLPSTLRSEVFEKHWLDFERVYEEAGWNVEYDKPAYYESYNAFFKFFFYKKGRSS